MMTTTNELYIKVEGDTTTDFWVFEITVNGKSCKISLRALVSYQPPWKKIPLSSMIRSRKQTVPS